MLVQAGKDEEIVYADIGEWLQWMAVSVSSDAAIMSKKDNWNHSPLLFRLISQLSAIE